MSSEQIPYAAAMSGDDPRIVEDVVEVGRPDHEPELIRWRAPQMLREDRGEVIDLEQKGRLKKEEREQRDADQLSKQLQHSYLVDSRIIIKVSDVLNLDESVRWRSGNRFSRAFKDQVAIMDTYEGTCHHIIPKSAITEHILKPQQGQTCPQQLEQRRQVLEEYVNQPHIHKPLSSLIRDRPAGNPGVKFHSSILWNPNNLVRGPKSSTRSDDPHYGKPQPKPVDPIRVDQALLDMQSQSYQESVDSFINVTKVKQLHPQGQLNQSLQALKEFGNIPKPDSATYAAKKIPYAAVSNQDMSPISVKYES